MMPLTARPVPDSLYGGENQPAIVTGVICNEMSERLDQCSLTNLSGASNCSEHSGPAGVVCQGQ